METMTTMKILKKKEEEGQGNIPWREKKMDRPCKDSA